MAAPVTTDVPGVSRTARLRMLGGSCVPHQAVVAYTVLGVTPAASAGAA